MKFYIASKLENAEQVKRVASVLKAAGHEHTYDWTTHGSVKEDSADRLKEVMLNEYNGVKESDMVIVLMPGGRGTHAELVIVVNCGRQIKIMYELKTYPEKEQFYKENKRVGFCGDESLSEIGDIWIMELYQNKSNGHYSLFITTDSDESWLIYDFDKRAKVTKSEV